MKKILFISATFVSTQGICCTTCNKQVQEGIYTSTFYPNLLVMLSAFIVLMVINIIFTRLATKKYHLSARSRPEIKELACIPLTSAAMILGIGLGGFTDGIVLHQVLQWHEMLTNKIPADTVINKSVNMFWDGIFHFFTLITTTAGVFLLWKLLNRENINRSGYLLAAGIFSGWGLFNLVEGIIDHHVLKLHNVRELTTQQALWNYGFLLFGIILLIIGWLCFKKGEKAGRII